MTKCPGSSHARLAVFQTSGPACADAFDNNYGYLIANADKKPLETKQGRHVFAGTRNEAPSGEIADRAAGGRNKRIPLYSLACFNLSTSLGGGAEKAVPRRVGRAAILQDR
jgi:hypothetical protein